MQTLSDVPALAWGLIVIASTVVGVIVDLIMGDHGFGPFGDGILIALGVTAGLVANTPLLGLHQARDPLGFLILAVASAGATLMAFGALKRWL